MIINWEYFTKDVLRCLLRHHGPPHLQSTRGICVQARAGARSAAGAGRASRQPSRAELNQALLECQVRERVGSEMGRKGRRGGREREGSGLLYPVVLGASKEAGIPSTTI